MAPVPAITHISVVVDNDLSRLYTTPAVTAAVERLAAEQQAKIAACVTNLMHFDLVPLTTALSQRERK
jgi:hypothetical protein